MATTSQVAASKRTLSFFVAIAIVSILYLGKHIIVPLALSVLFTFIATPVVTRLEKVGIRRVIAVILVAIFSLGFVVVIGGTVAVQTVDLVRQIPQYKGNISKKIQSVQGPAGQALNQLSEAVKDVSRELSKKGKSTVVTRRNDVTSPVSSTTVSAPVPVQLVPAASESLQNAVDILGPVVTPLGTALIVLVLSVFMLIQREDLRDRLIRLAGRSQLRITTQVFDDVGQRLSRYLLMQLLLNASVGLTVGVGLYFVGVPNAALWGLLTAILKFVPFIGPWIAASLPLALSIAVFDSWTGPLLTLTVFLVVEFFSANVIEPMLYGPSTGLSPIALLTAAAFWTWLWGSIGLILATPLTVCLAVLGRNVRQFEVFSILLSDEPVLEPEVNLYQRLLAGDKDEAADVAERFVKTHSVEELYQELLLKSLQLAEQDKHRNELDDEKRRFIYETLNQIVDEYNEASLPDISLSGADDESEISTLIVPLSDDGDEIAANMYQHLLKADNLRLRFIRLDETREALAPSKNYNESTAICISVLPPFAVADLRYLCRRLKSRFPKSTIIACIWSEKIDETKLREKLQVVRADHVVTTLRDLRELLAQISYNGDGMSSEDRGGEEYVL